MLLHHYWKQDFKATDAVKRICEIEDDDIVKVCMAQKLFKRFSDGDLNLQRGVRQKIQHRQCRNNGSSGG